MIDYQRPAQEDSKEKLSSVGMYDLFIALLTVVSLLVVGIMFSIRFVNPASPIIESLKVADTVICAFFIFDTTRQMFRAANKRKYIFWNGSLDLIGSVPYFPILRIARLSRLTRDARLIRALGTRSLAREFLLRRAEGALYFTLMLALLMLIFGSSMVTAFEHRSNDANIRGGTDAFWWTFVTITTVGYGDYYPVTEGGRIIGMMLMALGIVIFGVLTTFMSSVFITSRREVETDMRSINDGQSGNENGIELEMIRRDLTEVRQQLTEIRSLLQTPAGHDSSRQD